MLSPKITCGSLHPPSHQNSGLGQTHTSPKSKNYFLGNEQADNFGLCGSGLESDLTRATGPKGSNVSAGKLLKQGPTSHGLSFKKGLFSEAGANGTKTMTGPGPCIGKLLDTGTGPELINGQELVAGHVFFNTQRLGNIKGP